MQLFAKQKTKRLKIFNGIEDSVVDEIFKRAERKKFLSWETIIQQNDYPNSTGYIIEEWSVVVEINGKETAKLTPGDIFGEIALLNDEPRTASVIAESDVKTILITEDMLFEMINNDNNSINKEIMRRMEENLMNE